VGSTTATLASRSAAADDVAELVLGPEPDGGSRIAKAPTRDTTDSKRAVKITPTGMDRGLIRERLVRRLPASTSKGCEPRAQARVPGLVPGLRR